VATTPHFIIAAAQQPPVQSHARRDLASSDRSKRTRKPALLERTVSSQSSRSVCLSEPSSLDLSRSRGKSRRPVIRPQIYRRQRLEPTWTPSYRHSSRSWIRSFFSLCSITSLSSLGSFSFFSLHSLVMKRLSFDDRLVLVPKLGMVLTVCSRLLDSLENLWVILIYSNPDSYPTSHQLDEHHAISEMAGSHDRIPDPRTGHRPGSSGQIHISFRWEDAPDLTSSSP